jgi:UDP-3-O-[3-hydroxymyristoyl] glucosamine N-acyltransferase
MRRTAQEVAAHVGGQLRGDGLTVLDSVASLKNADVTDLSYAEERFHDDVVPSRAGCVIVRSGEFPSKTVIIAGNPKLAFARAAAWLLAEATDDVGIHPSATVAPDAKIGERVKIGAGAVIESAAVIGSSSIVEAGCYVGNGARIGDNLNCTRVVIYKGVKVDRVIIHAGAVIETDGFASLKTAL